MRPCRISSSFRSPSRTERSCSGSCRSGCSNASAASSAVAPDPTYRRVSAVDDLWDASPDACWIGGRAERLGIGRRAAGYLGSDGRRDLGAEELDRAHDVLVGDRADADLRDVAVVSEELVLEEDLLGDLFGRADRERSSG